MDPGGSSSSSGGGGGVDVDLESFLAGLRVLAVDDDLVCLKILEMQLRYYNYNVTAVSHAETALEMLRARKDGNQFDLVISDVHMPDMDGFKLLELVGLEMDIPVIMLSANEEMETMMKGIKHGAYDYLVKPVHLDQIKNIWLHVVKKGKSDPRNYVRGGADNDAVQKNQSGDATTDKNDAADDTRNCSRKNKKDGDDPEDDGEKPYSSAQKRPRIQWSAQLHRKFVDVVHYIGIDRAVPKKILEMMNEDGLSREQVASHLQKYRLGLKRLSLGTYKQPSPYAAEPEGWRRDWNYMNMNGLDGPPSALGMHRLLHSRQPVPPMMSSQQRNLVIPSIGGPGGHGSSLLNGKVKFSSSGNSFGGTSNGGGGLSSGQVFSASGLSSGYIGNLPNGMAFDAGRAYAVSGSPFGNMSNGTQPLPAGLCYPGSSWNAGVPSSLVPGCGLTGVGTSAGAPSQQGQGNGLTINQLASRLAAASSGRPMTATIGNGFQNQISAPAVGFGEQMAPFNFGSNANSVSVPNCSSALATAPGIKPAALPYIQIGSSDMQTQVLNGGGGSGNLPEGNGTFDQQAVGGLMETSSEAPSQMSGDLDDLVAEWLNQQDS